MPVYGAVVAGNQRLIYPGDSFLLFNAEQPQNNVASISACLSEIWGRRLTGLGFEFIFASNPGTPLNYQIQGADTDEAAAFFTEGSGTITAFTAMGDGTFRARVELSPWVARFVRVLVNTVAPNNPALTVKVSPI